MRESREPFLTADMTIPSKRSAIPSGVGGCVVVRIAGSKPGRARARINSKDFIFYFNILPSPLHLHEFSHPQLSRLTLGWIDVYNPSNVTH